MLKYIHSDKNQQVKQWKKLQTRKERDKTGTFIVEGFHLVEEALSRKEDVAEIILSEKTEMPPSMDYGSVPVTMVTEEIARQLAETETTQGIFAVCKQPKYTERDWKTFLLIDAVQDPGNLGTMIRTADAAGIDAVVVGKGSVDIYNPKVLRSAQGSHFHLPVLAGDLFTWMEKLAGKNVPVYGTALENGISFTETKHEEAFALIVGNEGSGVNKDILQQTSQNLYIPIYGKSESLNVAVAAGILLYSLSCVKK